MSVRQGLAGEKAGEAAYEYEVRSKEHLADPMQLDLNICS